MTLANKIGTDLNLCEAVGIFVFFVSIVLKIQLIDCNFFFLTALQQEQVISQSVNSFFAAASWLLQYFPP